MKPLRYILTLFLYLASINSWAATDGKITVLITGANRGLGYEFAKQYHADGYHVIATARKPQQATKLNKLGVEVKALDVTSQQSVNTLASDLKGKPIDILINNAGISAPHQTLKELDFDKMKQVFDVNSIGPIRVAQALLPNLMQGHQKKIINISSQLGSITNNVGSSKSSYRYSYRASKTALNQLNKSMANELGQKGFTCVVLHPGWVRTDMGGPNATYSPKESIQSMIDVINRLSTKDNGAYMNLDGNQLPW